MSWQKENLFNWLSSPNDEEHPAAKKVCMLYTSKRKRRKEDHVSACPVPARVQLSQEKGGKIGYVLVVIYTIERKEEKEKGEKAKKVVRRRRGSWRRERCEKKKKFAKEKKYKREEEKRRRNCRMSKDVASFAQLQEGIWYLKFRTWSRRIAPGKCVFFFFSSPRPVRPNNVRVIPRKLLYHQLRWSGDSI